MFGIESHILCYMIVDYLKAHYPNAVDRKKVIVQLEEERQRLLKKLKDDTELHAIKELRFDEAEYKRVSKVDKEEAKRKFSWNNV